MSVSLESLLDGEFTKAEREEIIRTYISNKEHDSCRSQALHIKEDLEWMNTSEALNFTTNLKGKLVILDFFTYCCINCMHILPDLEKLEDQFSITDGLIIVGVHSAKFDNEKTSANILSAILRYNITHPVVNDDAASMWNELDITCWPTLVVVSPAGKRLVTYVGEGHLNELLEFCEVALNFYRSRGDLSDQILPICLAKDSLPPSILYFPGKIDISPDGQQLVISDSGHHRILITTTNGVVLYSVGGPQSGYHNGGFEEARFNAPQGVVWHGHSIYVADTENHSIRLIDVNTRRVTSIAGTGEMGDDKEGGNAGIMQPISSPWDVAVGGPRDSVLFIAMAGTHQIWTLFLEDTTWLKGRDYKKGVCVRFAGSGREENRNNSYPHKAAFAQPSGISLAKDEKNTCMFVADSESSSIRSVSLKDGATKAIVGGERDPMNLFAFGDVDGKGIDAKLQHPLGVAWNPVDQNIYVVDSYNHKLKMVDPVAKTCTTVAGTGNAGKQDGTILEEVEFNEPGGLCVTSDGRGLFIADTNNHAIQFVDLYNKSVKELNIIISSGISEEMVPRTSAGAEMMSSLVQKNTRIIHLNAISLPANSHLTVQLDLRLPKYCKLTDGAPTVWQAYTEDLSGKQVDRSFQQQKSEFVEMHKQPSRTWEVARELIGFHGSIKVEVKVYFCEASGTCHMQGVAFSIPVIITGAEAKKEEVLSLTHQIS